MPTTDVARKIRCSQTTRAGQPCQRWSWGDLPYCEAHAKSLTRSTRALQMAREAAAELGLDVADDHRDMDIIDALRQMQHRMVHMMNLAAGHEPIDADDGSLTPAGATWLMLSNSAVRLTDALAKAGIVAAALKAAPAPEAAPVDRLRAMLDTDDVSEELQELL